MPSRIRRSERSFSWAKSRAARKLRSAVRTVRHAPYRSLNFAWNSPDRFSNALATKLPPGVLGWGLRTAPRQLSQPSVDLVGIEPEHPAQADARQFTSRCCLIGPGPRHTEQGHHIVDRQEPLEVSTHALLCLVRCEPSPRPQQ